MKQISLNWWGSDPDGCPLASCPTSPGVESKGCSVYWVCKWCIGIVAAMILNCGWGCVRFANIYTNAGIILSSSMHVEVVYKFCKILDLFMNNDVNLHYIHEDV